MIYPWYDVLFALIVAHAVTDLGLQGPQFAAKVPGNPLYWPVMIAHALINAGGVWVVFASMGYAEHAAFLAKFEFFSHLLIDYWKSNKKFNGTFDYFYHLQMKFGLLYCAVRIL